MRKHPLKSHIFNDMKCYPDNRHLKKEVYYPGIFLSSSKVFYYIYIITNITISLIDCNMNRSDNVYKHYILDISSILCKHQTKYLLKTTYRYVEKLI